MQSTLELGQNNLVAAYTSLGMQFADMKRYQEGMQFFYMALQLNPREEVVRRNLALALTALGASTYKPAGLPPNEEFNRFIDMGLSLSEALNAFGATLAGRGRMIEAQDALRKALEVDPGNELARNNLELLESREMHSELPLGISPLETRGAQLAAVQ
jgi:tetratricopeptide (TPR) repeat protein